MKFEKYGIKLIQLTTEKIELVRNWRNDPKINQFMDFKDFITEEMQLNWFNKINNKYNFYFIIEVDGLEVGLVNIKDINYENHTGETGIFIYEDAYLNTDLSFRAILCANDFYFETLKMEILTGRVLKNNKRAIRFNKALGSKEIEVLQDVNYNMWHTTREDYQIAKNNILKLLNL
jgi:UDP-4-amino-4,6-dideoxy-N-acetyl-beta-L-altrosamine N-acetyltransferase